MPVAPLESSQFIDKLYYKFCNSYSECRKLAVL
jgi:hypothetical protein